MKRFCVIGDPVEHSRSPAIFRGMFDYLNVDGVYIKQHVSREQCAGFLAAAKRGEFDAFNATIPHKELLVPLVDELTAVARRAGSVNTVAIRQGRAWGHSTDGAGLLAALDELGAAWRGETVCLFGAGGAAAAAAAALLEGGADRLIICNRTLATAETLAGRIGGKITAIGFASEQLEAAVSQAAVIVNCTSLGMKNSAPFADLNFLKAAKDDAAVYDMVYAPTPTALTAAAAAQGLRCANGEGMLLYQAVAAMEFFLETELDRPAIYAAVRRHSSYRQAFGLE